MPHKTELQYLISTGWLYHQEVKFVIYIYILNTEQFFPQHIICVCPKTCMYYSGEEGRFPKLFSNLLWSQVWCWMEIKVSLFNHTAWTIPELFIVRCNLMCFLFKHKENVIEQFCTQGWSTAGKRTENWSRCACLQWHPFYWDQW